MKTILPYRVKNRLANFLKKEQQNRMSLTRKRVLLKDIEEELAKHCGISINAIRRIKNGLCYPSIETTFSIAKFFNVKIKEVFELENFQITP
jgi:DNA-binding XRE family transcriptional regulator